MNDGSSETAQADTQTPPAPSFRLADGALAGAAIMLAVLGVNYAAEAAWHIPFAPRTLGQWLHLPLGTGVWAVLYLAVGAGFGALYERVRTADSARGTISGLLIGVLTFVLSLPATLSVAQNTESGLPVFGMTGWLGLCLLWGLALDQTERGIATRPIQPMDTDSPMTARRMFLLQTIAGALLIALFSFPMARLIDGRQLLPNWPSLTQTAPIPPGDYF